VGVISLLAVALNHPHSATGEAAMPLFHQGLPVLAAGAAAALVLVERRVRVPLLDWALLRRRTFAAAIGVNGVLHLTMMAGLFLGPLLAVRGLGMDTAAGGLLLVAVQSSVVATSFLGGWLHDRTRAAWLRPAASGLVALGLAAWALAGLVGSYPGLVVAGLVAGGGSGMLLAANNAVIMASLPPRARGVASGMLETTRHFGHAFGVTIPTAILALFLVGAGAEEALALRQGFAAACLAMAVVAALGAGLATVQPAPLQAMDQEAHEPLPASAPRG
jgi:hypothetical protein